MSKSIGRPIKVPPGEREPCPRCRKPMAVIEPREITAKQKAQEFYFSRWYRCENPGCATTTVMPEAFKVWKDRAFDGRYANDDTRLDHAKATEMRDVERMRKLLRRARSFLGVEIAAGAHQAFSQLLIEVDAEIEITDQLVREGVYQPEDRS